MNNHIPSIMQFFFHVFTGCQIATKSDITEKKFSSVLSKFLKDDLLPTASYQPLIIDCGNMSCQVSKSGIQKYMHFRPKINTQSKWLHLGLSRHIQLSKVKFWHSKSFTLKLDNPYYWFRPHMRLTKLPIQWKRCLWHQIYQPDARRYVISCIN